MQPSGHLRVTEFGDPEVVPVQVVLGQPFVPLPAGSPAKEFRVVVPEMITLVGREVVGPAAHLGEPGRPPRAQPG